MWTPEPLPITQADGDLSVTLTALATELADATGDMSSTRAIFHTEISGHPEQSWRPKSVQISDATGNKWIPYVGLASIKRTNNTDEYAFAGTLWRGEGGVEVARGVFADSGF